MPYLPMVKAIAPNAPIGAAFIRIATSRNIDQRSAARAGRAPARPRSPTSASAMPNRIATNSTCRIVALGQRRQQGVGDDVQQEAGDASSRAPWRHRSRPSLASSVAGSMLHARARLDDIGDDQADDQRQGREEQEIGERLAGDAADRRQVAHAGDAGDDGQEDHRRDDHLDQLDEAVAERLQRLADGRPEMADQVPSAIAISTWT